MGRSCSIGPASWARSIAFEAAVAGGIPIIANISQCLSANQIQSIHAILNGTSNFILTQMEEQGTDYPTRVAKPSGAATPRPIRRWTSTAATPPRSWRSSPTWPSAPRVDWRDIPRRGIDSLDVADLRYAKELGYRIKLLAVAELPDGGVELHVSPTLVRLGAPLAEVRGAYNAIRVVGDAVGPLFFHGLGAGQMPTASAVVADLIDTVVGRAPITFRTLELWSKQAAAVRAAAITPSRPAGSICGSTSTIGPGVMAEIAGDLGPARNFDRLGHSARRRADRRRRRAAGDHDAHRHRSATCKRQSKPSIDPTPADQRRMRVQSASI